MIRESKCIHQWIKGLLGKFPGFRLTCRMTTFLYPVVRNLSLRAREKAARLSLPDSIPAAAQPPPADDGLTEVVQRLPEAQREVLLLRYADGFSLKEVAETLNIPLGTVKSRLHHALSALREDPRTRRYFEA